MACADHVRVLLLVACVWAGSGERADAGAGPTPELRAPTAAKDIESRLLSVLKAEPDGGPERGRLSTAFPIKAHDEPSMWAAVARVWREHRDELSPEQRGELIGYAAGFGSFFPGWVRHRSLDDLAACIVEAMDDPDEWVRRTGFQRVNRVLESRHREEGMSRLLAGMNTGDPGMLEDAARALRNFAPWDDRTIESAFGLAIGPTPAQRSALDTLRMARYRSDFGPREEAFMALIPVFGIERTIDLAGPIDDAGKFGLLSVILGAGGSERIPLPWEPPPPKWPLRPAAVAYVLNEFHRLDERTRRARDTWRYLGLAVGDAALPQDIRCRAAELIDDAARERRGAERPRYAEARLAACWKWNDLRLLLGTESSGVGFDDQSVRAALRGRGAPGQSAPDLFEITRANGYPWTIRSMARLMSDPHDLTDIERGTAAESVLRMFGGFQPSASLPVEPLDVADALFEFADAAPSLQAGRVLGLLSPRHAERVALWLERRVREPDGWHAYWPVIEAAIRHGSDTPRLTGMCRRLLTVPEALGPALLPDGTTFSTRFNVLEASALYLISFQGMAEVERFAGSLGTESRIVLAVALFGPMQWERGEPPYSEFRFRRSRALIAMLLADRGVVTRIAPQQLARVLKPNGVHDWPDESRGRIVEAVRGLRAARAGDRGVEGICDRFFEKKKHRR